MPAFICAFVAGIFCAAPAAGAGRAVLATRDVLAARNFLRFIGTPEMTVRAAPKTLSWLYPRKK